MPFATLPLAGEIPDAAKWGALLGEVRPIFARKTADESLASNVTLQDDDHLFVAVVANVVYKIDLLLITFNNGGAAAGDLKYAFTQPAGASCSYAQVGPHVSWPPAVATDFEVEFAGRSVDNISPTGATAVGLNNTNFGVHIKGILVTGANAGTFRLQWAQNGSNASPAIVRTGSYMHLQQMA